MKKFFKIFIIFLFLFIAISAVSASDNSSDVCENGDGEILNVENESGIVQDSYKLETANLVKYYKNDSHFNFKVLKGNDTPVSCVNVSLKVNGVTYSRTTDENGSGLLKISLVPGSYKIITSYANKSKTNTIKVLSRFNAKDIASTYGKQTKFSLTLLDKQGNLMKSKLVTFKVGSKTFKVNTTSKGIASITLNLNAGTYDIKYSADGISGKNRYVVKNYYKIITYKWKSGADVTKNKLIKANIPDSAIVKKVIKAAKSGTPVIKFKGGKGKAVFITAGVHGNELSSQVAAMQLIKYFEKNPTKGTVYIMPFMNPKATAKNVRNYGVNLNSYANKKGTISYKTVKLIVKFKCSAYGDFHCTKPGGKPGKNVAMGTYKPTAKSATLAKYIAKNSKVKYKIYKKAGVEYPGALEDMVSLKGIPAVTCEVITPHGTIAKGTVPISLSMMKSFLKFSSLI